MRRKLVRTLIVLAASATLAGRAAAYEAVAVADGGTLSGTVTGSFELKAQVAAGTPKEISMKNGKVTQKTTSLSTSGGPGPRIRPSQPF